MPLLKLPEPVIASSIFFRFQVNQSELGRTRKGQARCRGSLRSPFTEPSQFQATPQLWKRKKKIEISVLLRPPSQEGVSMCAHSQLSDFDRSSSQPLLGEQNVHPGLTAPRSCTVSQREGADDFAMGSTRKSESPRTHGDATPSLAFSARGPGRHRDPKETCGKLGSAVRAR